MTDVLTDFAGNWVDEMICDVAAGVLEELRYEPPVADPIVQPVDEIYVENGLLLLKIFMLLVWVA